MLYCAHFMAELDNPQLFGRIITFLQTALGVQKIIKIDSGLEFCILRADTPDGSLAIKIPQDRVFSNVNDPHIDSKVLVDQEFQLMCYVKSHGITQVPEAIKKVEAEGFSMLVMQYVPSDQSTPDSFKLGQLLASVHNIKAPDIALSAQESEEIPELIVFRLRRRWGELQTFVQDLPPLPDDSLMLAALAELRGVHHLLHMDFRRANFRMDKGQVIALLDWSNALIGPPALELMRLSETGEVNSRQLLRGYAAIRPVPQTSLRAEYLMRLDSAVMIALVHLSEAPDPKQAPKAISRVIELIEILT